MGGLRERRRSQCPLPVICYSLSIWEVRIGNGCKLVPSSAGDHIPSCEGRLLLLLIQQRQKQLWPSLATERLHCHYLHFAMRKSPSLSQFPTSLFIQSRILPLNTTFFQPVPPLTTDHSNKAPSLILITIDFPIAVCHLGVCKVQ